MPEPAQLPPADTSDMFSVHQVFRDALTSAPQLIGDVAPGDTARAEFVANHYANVLHLLHGHHDGEDELMTPRLLARRPDERETILRIAGQHADVLEGIDALHVGLATWQGDPSAVNSSDAVAQAGTLYDALVPHLDEEEREILPIASSCMNVAEWGELPEHGMRNFSGDKPWLILGLIQDQMSPAQVAGMEAHMPTEIVQFWTTVGRPMYLEHKTQLFG